MGKNTKNKTGKRVLIISDYDFGKISIASIMYSNALNKKYDVLMMGKNPLKGRELNLPARLISSEIFSLKKLIKRVLRRSGAIGPRFNQTKMKGGLQNKNNYKLDKKDSGFDFPYFMQYLVRQFQFLLKCLFLPRPHCIIALNATELWAARWLSAIYNIPYIYLVWEFWSHQHTHFSHERCRTRACIEKIGVSKARGIIVDEPRWRRFLSLRYKVEKERFALIPVCPQALPHTTRPEPQIPIKFYYHGIYVAERRLDILINAFAQVDGAHLYMRGFGPLENKLREIADEKNLKEKITFLPPLDSRELPESGLDYDIGVLIWTTDHPGVKFMVGFKFFEYLISGLGIMTIKTSALSSFLNKYNIGLIYRNTNEKEIADQIQYCVDHPDQVYAWKKEAQRLAEEELNSKVQGDLLLDFVTKCIEQGR